MKSDAVCWKCIIDTMNGVSGLSSTSKRCVIQHIVTSCCELTVEPDMSSKLNPAPTNPLKYLRLMLVVDGETLLEVP